MQTHDMMFLTIEYNLNWCFCYFHCSRDYWIPSFRYCYYCRLQGCLERVILCKAHICLACVSSTGFSTDMVVTEVGFDPVLSFRS